MTVRPAAGLVALFYLDLSPAAPKARPRAQWRRLDAGGWCPRRLKRRRCCRSGATKAPPCREAPAPAAARRAAAPCWRRWSQWRLDGPLAAGQRRPQGAAGSSRASGRAGVGTAACDRETGRQLPRLASGSRDREAERQRSREAERQRDREAERQRERPRHQHVRSKCP